MQRGYFLTITTMEKTQEKIVADTQAKIKEIMRMFDGLAPETSPHNRLMFEQTVKQAIINALRDQLSHVQSQMWSVCTGIEHIPLG